MPPLLGAEKPVCKETLSAKPCKLLYESFPADLTVRNVNSRIVITPVQKAAMLECFDVFFSLNTSRHRDLICLLPSGLPHLAGNLLPLVSDIKGKSNIAPCLRRAPVSQVLSGGQGKVTLPMLHRDTALHQRSSTGQWSWLPRRPEPQLPAPGSPRAQASTSSPEPGIPGMWQASAPA